MRIALILTAAVSELLLDVLEDTAAGWTIEMWLVSSARYLVSFFSSSLYPSVCFLNVSCNLPFDFLFPGLLSAMRVVPAAPVTFLVTRFFLASAFLGRTDFQELVSLGINELCKLRGLVV